jgi:hypothetical protein
MQLKNGRRETAFFIIWTSATQPVSDSRSVIQDEQKMKSSGLD